MNTPKPNVNPHYLFTYRKLRRVIGYLGVLLAVMLVALSCFRFFNTPMQPSISHYYFTNLKELFTGTLCAVGLFMICYKGHGNASVWKNDNLLTNVAGIMAIGVALVPTTPLVDTEVGYTLFPYSLGWLHYTFAGTLFLVFSLLAINVFTIGQQRDTLPVSMFNENNIYRFCGYAILVCIILVPVMVALNVFKYATLVLESLALLAFGIAWLIKGRALGDKGKIGEKVYCERNVENTEDMMEKQS